MGPVTEERTMSKRVWHQCSECLPDKDELVFVTVQEPGRWYTADAAYVNGEWYLDRCDRIYGRVLEWAEETDAG
jgi:hypothetical protein